MRRCHKWPLVPFWTYLSLPNLHVHSWKIVHLKYLYQRFKCPTSKLHTHYSCVNWPRGPSLALMKAHTIHSELWVTKASTSTLPTQCLTVGWLTKLNQPHTDCPKIGPGQYYIYTVLTLSKSPYPPPNSKTAIYNGKYIYHTSSIQMSMSDVSVKWSCRLHQHERRVISKTNGLLGQSTFHTEHWCLQFLTWTFLTV